MEAVCRQSGLPCNGTYGILNYGAGKYLDLEVGNVAPNTPIIGWAGHGFLNQQVIMTLCYSSSKGLTQLVALGS